LHFRKQVDEAREKQNAKDFSGAEDILHDVLKSRPDYYRAAHNLGLLYQTKGETEKALAYLNKAKEIGTENSISDPLIYNSLGWTQLVAGRYEDAQATLLEGLKAVQAVESPTEDLRLSKARILNSLGYLYLQRGDTASARKYIQMSLDDYPTVGASSVLDIVNRVDAQITKTDTDADKSQIVAQLFSDDKAQREEAYSKITATQLRQDPAVLSKILAAAVNQLHNESGVRSAIITLRDMSPALTRQDSQKAAITAFANKVTDDYPQLQKETAILLEWLNTPEASQHQEALIQTVQVVSIHVGGNQSKTGTFKYDAPPGYRITNVRLRERSKGGDAHYSQKILKPTHLEIDWSVKSRVIKGPFNVPLNTITAFLTLDAEITLEPASGEAAGKVTNTEETPAKTTEALFPSPSAKGGAEQEPNNTIPQATIPETGAPFAGGGSPANYRGLLKSQYRDAKPAPSPNSVPPFLAGKFSLSKPFLFEGAVDGSAAADVGDEFFVGATDEDNEFRLYDVKGGLSPRKLDVGVEAAVKTALGVEKIKECDLEGAAQIGELIFWIGSHGRNSEGKEKKERQVLFATKLSGVGKDAKLEIAGKVYTKLLDDLVNDPALAPFDLAKAATMAPKDEGALNIESLAADGDKLWIGFRNPRNKANEALLVPLLNPTEIIKEGPRAKLGEPMTLKLGGLGVRDMVAWRDGFLIIAGDFVDRFEPGAKPSRVFYWEPGTDPRDTGVDFGDLNPEAIVLIGEGDMARILILSDDGKYPGRSDKNVFRGVWLQANAPIGGGNGN
jgi:tetratricopeptide (TPR) repeat protein